MTKTFFCAVAAVLLSACAHAPEAPPPQPPLGELAQLEELFWDCDYVATTRGIDSTPFRECAYVTRELRRLKFDNSFNRLVEWWRANKPEEHGKRRARADESAL